MVLYFPKGALLLQIIYKNDENAAQTLRKYKRLIISGTVLMIATGIRKR